MLIAVQSLKGEESREKTRKGDMHRTKGCVETVMVSFGEPPRAQAVITNFPKTARMMLNPLSFLFPCALSPSLFCLSFTAAELRNHVNLLEYEKALACYPPVKRWGKMSQLRNNSFFLPLFHDHCRTDQSSLIVKEFLDCEGILDKHIW